MTRRLWIAGSGGRVRDTALPVLAASEAWELAGIASRRAKRIEGAGRVHEVVAFDTLDRERLADADLIYLCVAKPAVPGVLARLGPLVPERCELLIETPVLLVKHLGRLGLLRAFRRTWVSEDCSTLPLWDALRGERFHRAHFDRSAYAYHGIAMARTVLGADRVASARATDEGRTVRFRGGGVLTTREPRDYARGRLLLEGAGAPVADHDPGRAHRRLAALEEEGALHGFRLDDDAHRLSVAERSVVGAPAQGEGVFRWMDGMKRVGFLRLLEALAADLPAYALDDALEDAVVDWWLQRFRRYRATPFTDPRRAPARLGFRALTAAARLAGR